jgi:hypothetical protein
VEVALRIAHAAEHELTHAVPRLTAATVHAHPHDRDHPPDGRLDVIIAAA